MKNLDNVYTDTSCCDSLMRYTTDLKLLWKCVKRKYVERKYKMVCGISSHIGENRLRTEYNDIEKANLVYRE